MRADSRRRSNHFLADHLEPRNLLAAPPDFVGPSGTVTDSDGDIITFKLSGPGTCEAYYEDGGGLRGLAVIDPTSATKLTISVRRAGGGDGLATMTWLDSVTPLGSVIAPGVSFTSGIGVQDAREIRFADLLNGAELQVFEGTGRLKITMGCVQGLSDDPSEISLGGHTVTSFTADDLYYANVSASTILDFNVAGNRNDLSEGHIDQSSFTLSGSLGKLRSSRGVFNSTFGISGSVASVTTPTISSVLMNISGATERGSSLASLTSTTISTFSLFASAAIGTMTAAEWINDGTLIADRIGTLNITGRARASIAGDCSAHIDLIGPTNVRVLGKFTVAGKFTGTLRTDGSVGDLAFGQLSGALVGIGYGSNALPSVLPDNNAGFDYFFATVRSLTIGRRGSLGSDFVNSVFMAPTITKATLFNQNFDVPNGGNLYGIGANLITTLSLRNQAASRTLSGIDAPNLESGFPASNPLAFISNTSSVDMALSPAPDLLDGRIRFYRDLI